MQKNTKMWSLSHSHHTLKAQDLRGFLVLTSSRTGILTFCRPCHCIVNCLADVSGTIATNKGVTATFQTQWDLREPCSPDQLINFPADVACSDGISATITLVMQCHSFWLNMCHPYREQEDMTSTIQIMCAPPPLPCCAKLNQTFTSTINAPRNAPPVKTTFADSGGFANNGQSSTTCGSPPVGCNRSFCDNPGCAMDVYSFRSCNSGCITVHVQTIGGGTIHVVIAPTYIPNQGCTNVLGLSSGSNNVTVSVDTINANTSFQVAIIGLAGIQYNFSISQAGC